MYVDLLEPVTADAFRGGRADDDGLASHHSKVVEQVVLDLRPYQPGDGHYVQVCSRMPMRVAAVGLAVGLVLADSSVAVLALPAIYRELDVDLGDLHWVLTSFNLVLALVAIPAAHLTRRAGAVSTFAAGLAVFAAASAACALASSFGALLAFRSVQALGGAAAVVAALELLSGLVGASRRAVAVWVAAGVAGAALGPALGGVLTETISWEAVFAVQVPLALAPLPFLVGLRLPARRQGWEATRPRLAPNVALALLSAGLATALYLVVLLLIEGWGLSPIEAAAVVSALPLAAIGTAPLARRVESVAARAASGALLVAGGLAGLALLPGADWAWTLPPQLLMGAGLALALTALTEAAVTGPLRPLDGGVTIAARHAGVVLGLLLLTPILVGDLDRERRTAEAAGTARVLDSDLSATTKIDLTRELSERLEGARQIPALEPVFRSVDPGPREQPELARVEQALEDILDRAVTSSFTQSFLVAAALAFAALLPVVLPRTAPT